MIRAAGDIGATMIRDIAIIQDGKVLADTEQSFIVCFYNGKGEALGRGRGNFRGLKLNEQDMRVI